MVNKKLSIFAPLFNEEANFVEINMNSLAAKC